MAATAVVIVAMSIVISCAGFSLYYKRNELIYSFLTKDLDKIRLVSIVSDVGLLLVAGNRFIAHCEADLKCELATLHIRNGDI